MNEENKNIGEISGFDDAAADNGQINDTPKAEQEGYFAPPEKIEEQEPEIIRVEKIQPDQEAEEDKATPSFLPSGNYGQSQMFFDEPEISKKPKYKKEKRKYGAGVVVLSAVLAAIIGAGASVGAIVYGDKLLGKFTTPTPQGSISQNITNITVDKQSDSVIQAVAEKATQSVVGIRTTYAVNSFFGGSTENTGEGSGVIYSQDGYIVTNYHVIESAVDSQSASIKVFTSNDSGDGMDATVVGYNISNDLAVIKVNKTGLPAIEIASSAELKTGQYVAVIGCPGGLDFIGSISYGVVSGLNRKATSEDQDAATLIQTDAAINPGNSGGAMVNTQGKLVGVPSSKIASTEYEGMGFAIPSDTVVEICNKIILKENSPEPYIGIAISERYDSTTLQMLGYPKGAVVTSVAEDSPAEKAGIKRGDILTEFGGRAISNYSAFNKIVNEHAPGETVTAKFYRDGKHYSTSITISANS